MQFTPSQVRRCIACVATIAGPAFGITVASCGHDVTEPPLPRFAAVDAGGSHSCGVGRDGALYCWGSDAGGLLGDGLPLEGGPLPRRVASLDAFSAVAAGRHLTCALTVDGAPRCWGNPVGAPGDFVSNEFVPEPAGVPGDPRFVAIDARETVACGIAAAAVLYCWGSNGFGQLGTGIAEAAECMPGGVPNPCHPEPQPVGGEIRFTMVSTGDDYVCAISADSAGYCWGRSRFGRLGDGSLEDRASPTPIAGDLTLIGISTSSGHACALAADGAAYCWGYNGFGQLGIGTADTSAHASPLRVESGSVRFRSISAGGSHTCALATDGQAYCWGWGDVGQLGTGFNDDNHNPQAVVGGLTFSNVSAGELWHTCGTSVDGEVYCWGRNDDGEVGVDPAAASQSSVPVRLAAP
jgi:alpha-tubulin suppressor-like RCC1 family protein